MFLGNIFPRFLRGGNPDSIIVAFTNISLISMPIHLIKTSEQTLIKHQKKPIHSRGNDLRCFKDTFFFFALVTFNLRIHEPHSFPPI